MTYKQAKIKKYYDGIFLVLLYPKVRRAALIKMGKTNDH